MSAFPSVIGGSAQDESPECTPASSMCSITPPRNSSSPSNSPSTSISTASSRNRSISTGCSTPRSAAEPLQRRGQLGLAVDDLHARDRPARTTAAPAPGTRSRSAITLRLVERHRRTVLRRRQRRVREHLAERAALLRQVDRVRRRPDDRYAGVREPLRQSERGLPAELHDHPGDRAGLHLGVHDLEHVLAGERLEVQPVGGVVVGRDRLRVAVHHHRAVAGLAQRHRRVHAGVVELDPLPDPVRPRAEDQHGRGLARRDLASPRRTTSSGTASRPRTRPHRCRPS